MRYYLFLLSTIITLLIISCGPNKEEVAKLEQQKADSIALAIETKIKTEIELKEKSEMVDKILSELNNRLNKAKKRIITENINLDRIRDFQLGRSQSTKERQLEEQYELIHKIEDIVASNERAIKDMQSKKDKYSYEQIKEIFENMGLEK